MVVLTQEQRPPCAFCPYIVQICRKGKWRTLTAKAAAKDRLVGGGEKNRKEKKGRRKTALKLRSRGNEENIPLGSVHL